jgi:hypothetical protein
MTTPMAVAEAARIHARRDVRVGREPVVAPGGVCRAGASARLEGDRQTQRGVTGQDQEEE